MLPVPSGIRWDPRSNPIHYRGIQWDPRSTVELHQGIRLDHGSNTAVSREIFWDHRSDFGIHGHVWAVCVMCCCYHSHVTPCNGTSLTHCLKDETAQQWRPFIDQTHGSRSGLAFLPAKSVFCHLPVLTSLNRQKVAEKGKNENGSLAHITCFFTYFLSTLTYAIPTWCYQAKLTSTADMPPNVAHHWTLSSFSLASLLVQKHDNQPLTRNRTIFDRREASNVGISLFIYMSGLV